MIEEVVNSILEAEDVAQKKVAEAKQQADGIIAAAESAADQSKKQATAQTKAYFAEECQKADSSAESQAKAKLDELNAQTDSEVKGYAKNVDKAVKIILESL